MLLKAKKIFSKNKQRVTNAYAARNSDDFNLGTSFDIKTCGENGIDNISMSAQGILDPVVTSDIFKALLMNLSPGEIEKVFAKFSKSLGCEDTFTCKATVSGTRKVHITFPSHNFYFSIKEKGGEPRYRLRGSVSIYKG